MYPSITRRRVLLGLGGAGLLSSARMSRADEEVRIGYGSPGASWSVVYVADGLDTWRKYGITVQRTTFGSGRQAIESCLTGDVNFATAADTPFLFAALRGLKPMVVADFQRHSTEMRVVVRKDRGLVADAPASIKGKKIATPIGANGQYLLVKYLELAGLQRTDVTVVNMAPADAITATVRGDVDGFVWTNEAARSARRQAPDATMEMSLKGIERIFRSHNLLITNEKFAATRPQALKAAVSALLDAERAMRADKSWARFVAERTKASPQEIVDDTADFDFSVRFDKRFIDDMVAQAEWAIASGLAQRPSRNLRELFLSVLLTQPLKEVAPDRVDLGA